MEANSAMSKLETPAAAATHVRADVSGDVGGQGVAPPADDSTPKQEVVEGGSGSDQGGVYLTDTDFLYVATVFMEEEGRLEELQ